MATTIQVKDTTMRFLQAFKSETKAKSYDEALMNLFKRKRGLESMYGSIPKGDIMTDLRDKHDRF